MTANPDGVRLLALADPADVWDAYCAEVPTKMRSLQGALAFGFDAALRAGERQILDEADRRYPGLQWPLDDGSYRMAFIEGADWGLRNRAASAPARCDAGSVDRAILQELTRQSESGVKYLTSLNVDDLTKAILATPPALPAGEEVRRVIEECAKIVDDECTRVLSKQKITTAGDIVTQQSVNANLRMIAVLLPDISAAIRALSPSSNGKPATEKEG